MKIRWYVLAIILGIMLGQALARRGDKKRGPDWERRYAEEKAK